MNVERSIYELPWFLINGGRRGLQVRITPDALRILNPIPVDASQNDIPAV